MPSPPASRMAFMAMPDHTSGPGFGISDLGIGIVPLSSARYNGPSPAGQH